MFTVKSINQKRRRFHQICCLLFVLILSSCGGGEDDESLNAGNIGELMRELDISGSVSPEMEKFLRCLVGGPVGSEWKNWNALEMSRKRPDVFRWWVKECQRIAYSVATLSFALSKSPIYKQV